MVSEFCALVEAFFQTLNIVNIPPDNQNLLQNYDQLFKIYM